MLAHCDTAARMNWRLVCVLAAVSVIFAQIWLIFADCSSLIELRNYIHTNDYKQLCYNMYAYAQLKL